MRTEGHQGPEGSAATDEQCVENLVPMVSEEEHAPMSEVVMVDTTGRIAP